MRVRSKWAVALFGFLFKRFGLGLLEYFVGRHGIEMESAVKADEFIEYYLQSIYINFFLIWTFNKNITVEVGLVTTDLIEFQPK